MIPVLCFPPAGAGASFFARWRAQGDLALLPVALPGKEKRLAETPYRNMAELVAQLVPEVFGAIGDARRVALFGHSFGAVLAYEVAVAMAGSATRELQLFVSGSPGPTTSRAERITGLDDDAFLDGVRRLSGYWHEAYNEPELRELLLPGLRADIETHESYQPGQPAVLDLPVVALRGTDDALVSADATATWAGVTTGGFRLVELPGGHMYLVDRWPEVIRIIQSALSSPVTS